MSRQRHSTACQQGNYEETRDYPVYCPRVLAGIGEILRGPTRDRAFIFKLQRQTPEEKRERFRRLKRTEVAKLKPQIESWATANREAVRTAYEADQFPYLLGFADRTYDAVSSLAAILEMLDPTPEARARFLKALSIVRNEKNEAAQDGLILNALLGLSTGGRPVIGMASELAEWIRPSLPKITDQDVTETLRRYGFETKPARIAGGEPRKRYVLEHDKLADLVDRYLCRVVV